MGVGPSCPQPVEKKETTMWCRAVGGFVTLILSLLAVPLATEAQPPTKVARIGYLAMTRGAGSPSAEAFLQGLRDLGYVEGTTMALAYRAAEGKPERLPALAAELVQLPVDVLVAAGTQVALVAKATTTTLPIVTVAGADPVALGLAASLARPGGNLTGLTLMSTELAGKQLELLKEAMGRLGRVAVLWNARDAAMTNIFSEIQTAAPVLGVTVHPLGVHEATDIDSAITTMTADRPDAVFMITDVVTRRYTRQVVEFAAQHQLPTMFQTSEPVAEGGLMYYGPRLPEAYRRAAFYVDRILKGAKPADLPVEQPTKFELVINLKTAKALGLTIPPTLLFQADEVIR
jgi:putative ABC transport system substrate-binding protein